MGFRAGGEDELVDSMSDGEALDNDVVERAVLTFKMGEPNKTAEYIKKMAWGMKPQACWCG
jgi:hypothetical protein